MGFFKKTIKDVPIQNQTVLIRVDYNVPLKDGEVDDDLRIRASLPTLQYLRDLGCKLVLISHLGRPEGHDLHYSLEPAAKKLEELIKSPVTFVDDICGDAAYQAVKKAPKDAIVMFQNLRFDEREEADDTSSLLRSRWIWRRASRACQYTCDHNGTSECVRIAT